LRLSKRLVDSDLAVIGMTGIGPIRKISVLDWFLRIGPMKVFIGRPRTYNEGNMKSIT
jgi:hypothetical protein